MDTFEVLYFFNVLAFSLIIGLILSVFQMFIEVDKLNGIINRMSELNQSRTSSHQPPTTPVAETIDSIGAANANKLKNE